jgi:hypothetical protein
MCNPFIIANGQTYRRESIARWFNTGKSTCPQMGQVLANLEFVPNKCSRTSSPKWCRENGVTCWEEADANKSIEPAQVVAVNKAA